jgi:hypothetical protein
MSRPTVVAVLRALRDRNLHDASDGDHAWAADCPVCQPLSDGLAPLRITERKEDGPATLCCRNACDEEAILRAIGLADADTSRLRIMRASEVEIEAVRFLVPERVPLGAVTILCGDPGLREVHLDVRDRRRHHDGPLRRTGAGVDGERRGRSRACHRAAPRGGRR